MLTGFKIQDSKLKIQDSRPEKSSILNFEFLILNSRKAGAGFTLIEILISLTLLTIVLGAVYSSFFSVRNVLDRFDNVSLKYHEARTALDIMRREIEGAVLKNPPDSEDDNYDVKNRTSFIIKDRDILGKDASELELTAFSFKGNSVNTISYAVEEKENKLNLIKKEGPFGIQSGEYSMDLIEGIEGFTIETLFNNQWVRTWNASDTDKLPEVVKLSIEFDDNGKKVRLVEYARPKIREKP
ncbi:MAG: prepilin-type N-terminal cleavage/methylation domain-containing protein [Nitrospiraceae bacterium]|nr:MAG: prepilin-type N-terminal cleavage/methylation domain-containing protein [Nitrospiraceae bacterium]